ncbi:MAG: hypothetical protein JWQ71_326 [Pedosphaera sp.]|nr:hypothetical protein [Pedosphaera sp.]
MKTSCVSASKSSVFALLFKRALGFMRVAAWKKSQDIQQPRKLKLSNGGLWHINSHNEPRQIECSQGKIWITQSGCMADIVLISGQKQSVNGQGLVLVQALADSELMIQ